MSELRIEVVPHLGDVDATAWDRLCGQDDPFVEHAFLRALETSESVGEQSGWLPCHVLVYDDDVLSAALPLYAKLHSFGEFIFDFAWAQGADRLGIDYYPKLVSMVPFTPATGMRVLIAPDASRPEMMHALLQGADAARRAMNASSVHLLFLDEGEHAELVELGYQSRETLQFHWTQRQDAPYASYDAYLETFRSEARKQTRKERARAQSHGLRIVVKQGPELDDAAWRALAYFYESTCDKKGSETYLTPLFFEHLRASNAAKNVVAVLAYDGDTVVAGTLNFEKGQHLYGRYWGALREYDSLHFELCYHVLIERAISKRLSRVEAGAQGIHKLKRGFAPSVIYSAHSIAHPRLSAGVEHFLRQERAMTRTQIAELEHSAPFHRAHQETA